MRTYLSIISVIFFSISCSNNNPKPKALIGNWEWVSSYGGIAGQTIFPNDTTSYVLEISDKSNFKIHYLNGKKLNGTYLIVTEKSIFDQKPREIINFSDHFFNCSYSIKDDSLVLKDQLSDGYRHIFVKQ